MNAVATTTKGLTAGSVVRMGTPYPKGVVTNTIGRTAVCVQWPAGHCTKHHETDVVVVVR